MDTELRKLDAEIAEKVIGQRVGHLKRDVKQENPFDDYTPYRNTRTGELMRGMIYAEGMAVIGYNRVPRYSSDITVAMQVLEKMRERFAIDIESTDSIEVATGVSGWIVKFWAEGDIKGEDRCESLPEAICRAALATLNR